MIFVGNYILICGRELQVTKIIKGHANNLDSIAEELFEVSKDCFFQRAPAFFEFAANFSVRIKQICNSDSGKVIIHLEGSEADIQGLKHQYSDLVSRGNYKG